MMKTLKNHSIHLLIIFLAVTFYLVTLKPVFIRRNGALERMFTHAANFGVALRDAGLSTAGRGTGESANVGWGMILDLPDQPLMEFVITGKSRWVAVPGDAPQTVGDLLTIAGYSLHSDEGVLVDGVPLGVDAILVRPPRRMEIRTAVAFTVRVDGNDQQYQEIGPTVGEALWEAGIRVQAADLVEPQPATALDSTIDSPLTIEIIRGRPLTITADGKETSTIAAGKTVGEALANAGFALNGLDYSNPGEAEPLPADGAIQVIRVREDYLREQEPIPFERKTQLVAELELDQTQIVQPGIYGILEKTVRVRYEDGVEVARTAQGQQVLVPPQDRITGYGTKVVIRTMDTPDGTVEYYRAVRVYATSYYCGIINGVCNYSTTSGKQLVHGIIAMVWSWYYLFKGQGMYVDGYGPATVEDVVPGTPTSYWIDLAYPPPEVYKGWHQYTTLYFLTPVPANVPAILP